MHPNYPISFHSTCLIMALMVAMTSIDPCLAAIRTMATASTSSKQGCDPKCGNITIPYPFGIGIESDCSLNPFYDVFCNVSSIPHKPYLFGWEEEQAEYAGDPRKNAFEILEISEAQIRIRNPLVLTTCFNDSSNQFPYDFYFYDTYSLSYMSLTPNSPLSFSSTSNNLIMIGCQEKAGVVGTRQSTMRYGTTGSSCISMCSREEEVEAGRCDGYGCCQTTVPQGLRNIQVYLNSHSNDTKLVSFNPCGYTFLAEQSWFTFGGLSDLNDSNFPNRVMETVPVSIDWVIGNGTCADAQLNASSYACMGNTTCSDQFEVGIGGYKCFCKPGFEGSPYLSPGCSDIDECADPILSNCSNGCTNSAGSFECGPCPLGRTGDGKTNGTGCSKKTPHIFILKLCLGISSGCLLLFIGLNWLYIMDRKRQLMKMRKKFFQQNGGWLLKQQLSNFGSTEPTKIFTEEELKAATNSFHKDWIVGTGAYGTVYNGILAGNWLVAIKKSKSVDQNQIEQFINEVIILGQINHRNVVKLFGCCLETEVPLLVYEFIPKGTLYSHIHCSQNEKERSWRLTWKDCLRIASEAADAVTYLHSAASPPIIHRDIKSMNILLDDDYVAKIADFGGSRLIPMDQSKLPTLVQGTLGYLDPEYLHSSLLTEKSDVYSFGVVLAELLTRQKPFSALRQEEDRNLATYFVRSIEQETLFDILHPQWVNEASTLELISIASITQRCLRLSGKDRPTMREVSRELEAIKKLKKKPILENQIHDEIETTMLLHSYNTTTDAQSIMSLDEERDLYPTPREDETAMLFA